MARSLPLRALPLVLLALQPAAASAAAEALAEALAAVRSDLTLDETDALAGPGGRLLGAAAAEARTVVFGEDHGIVEVAKLASALWRQVTPAGFETMALEIGPAAAAEVERILRGADRHAKLVDWIAAHPFTLAFYDLAEEAALLERAAEGSPERLRLVGLDQELVGAAKLLLERARAAAATPATRAQIDELLREEADAYLRAAASHDPTELFMMTADAGHLEAARVALARESAAAAAPLDALLESREIYRLNAVEGFRSNAQRTALMRRSLHAALPGELPKLFVKLGAYHAYKGFAPLGSREIGNHLAELAEAAGGRSLHLLAVAAGGSQAQFAGVGLAPAEAPIDVAGPEGISALAPLVALASGRSAWSLFDLRALAGRAARLAGGDPELLRLLQGFDFVLVIPKGTAQKPIG